MRKPFAHVKPEYSFPIGCGPCLPIRIWLTVFCCVRQLADLDNGIHGTKFFRVMKHVDKGKNGVAHKQQGPRLTIRLTHEQAKRLARLGAVSRRQIPQLLRKNLDRSLTQWEAAHPALA